MQIVLIILCLLAGIGYFVYFKVIAPKAEMKRAKAQTESANLAINVKDIGTNEIFTLDNKVISIFRARPVNVELFTATEKATYVSTLTGCLASVKRPFKILSLPRPFDIQPFIESLQEQKRNANDIQKKIISEEIAELHNLVATGQIVERHFYILVWDDVNSEYARNRTEFAKSWEEKHELNLLNQQEIVRLCNLIFNPSCSVDEDEELMPTIPILNI